MLVLNGYQILGDFSTENAGLSRWAFCKKNGREFFIKEFLTPVYPENSGDLSPKTLERKRKVCEAYYSKKSNFYKALQQCRTGNIIIVQDFFRESSHYYAVTEKVNAIGSDPGFISALGQEQKMTMIKSILYSIAVLHRNGIVHADIKADNVLIKETTDGYYTAKIIDFDAGFLTGTDPENLQGDFVYLAPEAFRRMIGEKIVLGTEIDIFALGVLLHQYCTGVLPGFDTEYQYVFEAVLDGSDLKLSDKLPDVVRAVIRRMLERDPEDRITAADALKMLNGKSEPKSEKEPPKPSGEAETKGFFYPDDLD